MNEDHFTKRILDEIIWLHLQGILKHTHFHAKGEKILFHELLKIFHIFLIRPWKNDKLHIYDIGIKCNNCDKTVTYQLNNE